MSQIQQDFKKLLTRAAVDLACSMINLDFEATFIEPLAGNHQTNIWVINGL